MRVDPDFASPAAHPQPVKDGSPCRRDSEAGRHPKPKPGRAPEPTADDYDDGAWM